VTSKRWLPVLYAAIFALLLVLPHATGVMTRELIGRIFILAVFGMSYDILRGYTGIINLGHAAFFGGGTYVAGIIFTRMGTSVPALLLAVALSLAFAAVLALVMGQFAFRNDGSGGVLACAMITLAFGEIVRHTAETFRLVGSVWSGMGIDNQILAFIVVILGGMGSFYGSAVGSIIIGLTGAFTAWFFPPLTAYSTLLIMVIVLSLKPEGLFGLAVRK